MKEIAIILLNYNGLKDTLACLHSLAKIVQPDFKVIIYLIDFSVAKNESEKIKKAFPNIKLITKNKNLGFAGGNNIGINQALDDGADFVLLLNNDTLVSSDFISQLYHYLEQNLDVGAVSPKIYFAKGYEFHKDRYKEEELGKVIWYGGGQIDWANMYSSHIGVDLVDRGKFEQIIETDHISGCCVLIRKKALQQVGFFNEKLFLYWEDTDWSLRAKQFGWNLKMNPKAIIWHKNAGSSGSGSALQDYYLTRNRLWIGMHYAPIRTKLALIKQSLIQLIKGRQWEKRGVRDFWLGKMYSGSWDN